MDIGATEHVINDEQIMNNIVNTEPLAVQLANGTTVTAYRRGYVRIGIGVKTPRLYRAWLIPEIKLNLLSCSELHERGMSTIFERGKCILRDTEERNAVHGITQ